MNAEISCSESESSLDSEELADLEGFKAKFAQENDEEDDYQDSDEDDEDSEVEKDVENTEDYGVEEDEEEE